MAQTNATPKDLANFVSDKLKGSKIKYLPPNDSVLINLFENLFFTSLKTEEGQLIKVTITLINPENPDPTPPERISAHRWNYIYFEEQILFTVKNLVKLSKAADPWSSSLAVYHDDNGELFIWGMVDQAIHYQSFLNYETTVGHEQPGIFQATITDIGNIQVMFDYELIANLKQNVLVSNYIDVFHRGPVSEMLKANLQSYKVPIREFIESDIDDEESSNWDNYTDNLISETVSRILIGIQNYKHGGAFLITPSVKTGLNIKHKLSYDRLFNSIISLVKLTISNNKHTNTVVLDFLENDADSIPTVLYLDEYISESSKIETRDELKGVIRFITSLSCIDGLVVATPDLKIKGFGAVVRGSKMPDDIYISTKAVISEASLLAVKPNQFGTRHRSMFSYCWNHAGSLGFVVSQDGDIRAIARVVDRLIMWENIKVKHFIRSTKLNRPIRPNTSKSV